MRIFQHEKILASVALLASCSSGTESSDRSTVRQAATSGDELVKISAWAAAHNAPDGDVIDRVVTALRTYDCVPWELQPAVKGSKLHRADIIAPSENPSDLILNTAMRQQPLPGGAPEPAHTDYESSDHQCPPGSIPMRRYTTEEMARFKTLEDVVSHYETPPHVIQCPLTNPQRYYENYYTELSAPKPGGHIQIWVDLATSVTSGISFGQMWLTVNHHPCTTLTTSVETLESGWVRRAGEPVELFVFYTPDGYTHGCFNMGCPGMTPFTYLGGPVPGNAFSSSGYIDMAWQLYLPGNSYGVTPGWWFYANAWVGYYPLSIYDAGLQSGETLIGAGGEITTNHGAQMGNGKYGDDPGASYVSNYWYMDWDHNYHYVSSADYYGDGRFDTQMNGKYYVDGRQTFGWPVTGTFSIPIDSSKSFFRFGGPGPP